MKSITVAELFAGVGGFRLGLERASVRFRTIWANQWEPGKKAQHAFDCYDKHFGPSLTNSNEDIAIAKKDCPKVNLVVGGFPCQDYSVAHSGGAKGIEGKKGVLWWYINDIIKERKPEYVLLENVDRLLKSPAKQREETSPSSCVACTTKDTTLNGVSSILPNMATHNAVGAFYLCYEEKH